MDFSTVMMNRATLVAVTGFSLPWLLLSTVSRAPRLQYLRHMGSVVVVPGL